MGWFLIWLICWHDLAHSLNRYMHPVDVEWTYSETKWPLGTFSCYGSIVMHVEKRLDGWTESLMTNRNISRQKSTKDERENRHGDVCWREWILLLVLLFESTTHKMSQYFTGQHSEKAALLISDCSGVGVPRGHRREVRQCGCNVVQRGRMRREEKRQNLKNVPPQKKPWGG